MRIDVFNSPPQSGKDEVVKIMKQFDPEIVDIKYADLLGNMVRPLFGSQEEYLHYREAAKDQPLDIFGHTETTLRQLIISLSENTLKPLLGQDVLAQYTVREVEYLAGKEFKHITISDCGFQPEYDLLQNRCGNEHDIRLIRVERDGCNFDNDSRMYLNDKPDIIIDNNSTLTELRERVKLYL
jgi:hypothetical protein